MQFDRNNRTKTNEGNKRKELGLTILDLITLLAAIGIAHELVCANGNETG